MRKITDFSALQKMHGGTAETSVVGARDRVHLWPIETHTNRMETTMTFFEKVRDANAKRRLFNQTVSEIQSMPRDVALDLGIFPEDARRIARQAVYGK